MYTHGGSVGKNLPDNEKDAGLIPGSERSPGEGNGNPLQYSCLENSMDRGAWWTTVHEVAKLDTTKQLSTYIHIRICVYTCVCADLCVCMTESLCRTPEIIVL